MFATGGKICGRSLRVALSRYGRRNAWPENEKTRLAGRVSRKIQIVLVEKTIHLFALRRKDFRPAFPAPIARTSVWSGLTAAKNATSVATPAYGWNLAA